MNLPLTREIPGLKESMSDETSQVPHLGSDEVLDPGIRESLPSKSKVTNCSTYETAAWTRATRIHVTLQDGSAKSFFLKHAKEERGRQMIEGEFASISEIAKYNPALTPIPHAMGSFRNSQTPTYFLLLEFLNIETGAPNASAICKQLADMHARSVSPTGQFGFPMTTFHGPHPQNLKWENSWAVFFARLLGQFHLREMNANGPSKDGIYELEFNKLIDVTIPKILAPLQAGGRFLKPSLLHGDLWENNCGTELHTGQPKIFDAAVFYGHNEYELGMWRRPAIRFGKSHIKHYLKYMPPSEPEEQWDDRHRLYSIKFEVAHSIGWPASCDSQRQIILEDVSYLNRKYVSDGTNDGIDRGKPEAPR